MLRFASLLSLLLVTAGCGSGVSIPAWQKGVSTYVQKNGRGDPTVLRDMTIANGRPGFAIIGHHDTTESTDANGVLLGHEEVGGRAWFVYLVGLVQEERVGDVRLAALSMQNGRTIWKRGRGNPGFKTYRDYGLKQAKERFPDRDTPPPRYTGFPRPDDVFKLAMVDNGKLVATHEPSGARWEIVLPAK